MNVTTSCNTLARVRGGLRPSLHLRMRCAARTTIASALHAENQPRNNVVSAGTLFERSGRASPLRNGTSAAEHRRGIRLSLFTPYKSLPPDGQVIPEEEQMCNPTTSICKTHTYVYEERCEMCCGTGHARLSGRKLNRHGHVKLAVCVMCQGLGYVRCTSTQLPQAVQQAHDLASHTMVRNFTPEAELAQS